MQLVRGQKPKETRRLAKSLLRTFLREKRSLRKLPGSFRTATSPRNEVDSDEVNSKPNLLLLLRVQAQKDSSNNTITSVFYVKYNKISNFDQRESIFVSYL